jgi:transcriptional regulator with GAF, ATPase, and Fis domain
MGAAALYRADWLAAESALTQARSVALALEEDDPEEIARLDHNFGVVALYRGKIAQATGAFERSLVRKRALGDKAGVRSCLLNLGIAFARAERNTDAERALSEAQLLAQSMGQRAGLGWVLSARADLEVRRGRAEAAERWAAEAEAIGDALPAAVRADLLLTRAEIALLGGDGAAARAALAGLSAEMRHDDTMVDARALVIESRAHLAMLPAAPRSAARSAIAALRRARSAELPEAHAAALSALAAARRPRQALFSYKPRCGPGVSGVSPEGVPAPKFPPPSSSSVDDALFRWLDLARDAPAADCALDLARIVLAQAGAERAFVALARASGEILLASGADVDGFALGDAKERIPADLVLSALHRDSPVYQRDTQTSAGRGAQLAVASSGTDVRAVVVAEHRFAPGRFDHVPANLARRWATLAALVARFIAPQTVAGPVHAVLDIAPASTTSVPLAEPRRTFPTILGSSPAIRRALARLDAAIDSDLPVLFVGETGTGKEVFARALHDHGPRAARPFVAVNCAALPDALVEAELFGHARGSFTGAERARPGLIAHAEGGTLLFDEIGDLAPARQATLLRALESHRYRPVGSDDERPFDVRILAATNRDLAQAVRDGVFRQDLFFRLRVIEIRVPPLRERADDVPLLARTFLSRAGSDAELSARALAAVTAYAWPGNVRELEHQMQRLAALRLTRIEYAHLSREIRAESRAETPTKVDRERSERDEVARALAETGGNISHAAARLGLTRHGLKKRMLRLGMRATAHLSAKK